MEAVALGFDCSDVQADLELHCPYMSDDINLYLRALLCGFSEILLRTAAGTVSPITSTHSCGKKPTYNTVTHDQYNVSEFI